VILLHDAESQDPKKKNFVKPSCLGVLVASFFGFFDLGNLEKKALDNVFVGGYIGSNNAIHCVLRAADESANLVWASGTQQTEHHSLPTLLFALLPKAWVMIGCHVHQDTIASSHLWMFEVCGESGRWLQACVWVNCCSSLNPVLTFFINGLRNEIS